MGRCPEPWSWLAGAAADPDRARLLAVLPEAAGMLRVVAPRRVPMPGTIGGRLASGELVIAWHPPRDQCRRPDRCGRCIRRVDLPCRRRTRGPAFQHPDCLRVAGRRRNSPLEKPVHMRLKSCARLLVERNGAISLPAVLRPRPPRTRGSPGCCASTIPLRRESTATHFAASGGASQPAADAAGQMDLQSAANGATIRTPPPTRPFR